MIPTSRRGAPDATVMSPTRSAPLWKRRGVACLPVASDHDETRGAPFVGVFPAWDNTGPMTRENWERSVQFQKFQVNGVPDAAHSSDAIIESAGRLRGKTLN